MTTAQQERVNRRYIPEGSKVFLKNEIAAVYFYKCDKDSYNHGAIMYKGTSAKPMLYMRFKSEESRQAHVNKLLSRLNLRAEYFKNKKREKSLAQIVKPALKKAFFGDKVQCVMGRGTAAHWLEVRIDTVEHHTFGSKRREELEKKAMLTISCALEQAGARLSTYYSDDGYNSESSCMLLTVSHTESELCTCTEPKDIF